MAWPLSLWITKAIRLDAFFISVEKTLTIRFSIVPATRDPLNQQYRAPLLGAQEQQPRFGTLQRTCSCLRTSHADLAVNILSTA
jgi:hypothetical protein